MRRAGTEFLLWLAVARGDLFSVVGNMQIRKLAKFELGTGRMRNLPPKLCKTSGLATSAGKTKCF